MGFSAYFNSNTDFSLASRVPDYISVKPASQNLGVKAVMMMPFERKSGVCDEVDKVHGSSLQTPSIGDSNLRFSPTVNTNSTIIRPNLGFERNHIDSIKELPVSSFSPSALLSVRESSSHPDSDEYTKSWIFNESVEKDMTANRPFIDFLGVGAT